MLWYTLVYFNTYTKWSPKNLLLYVCIYYLLFFTEISGNLHYVPKNLNLNKHDSTIEKTNSCKVSTNIITNDSFKENDVTEIYEDYTNESYEDDIDATYEDNTNEISEDNIDENLQNNVLKVLLKLYIL